MHARAHTHTQFLYSEQFKLDNHIYRITGAGQTVGSASGILPTKSAVAVLELSVLSDGQFGGVAR